MSKSNTKQISAEESRIRELEAEGMTRSDAQGVYEAEQAKTAPQWTDCVNCDLETRADRLVCFWCGGSPKLVD